MEVDFWLERWKNQQIGFHQDQINVYLSKYWHSLGVEQGAHVFIPLAGKSKDVLYLAEQGYHVTAIELSEDAVKAFFDENQLSCTVKQEKHFQVFQSDNIDFYCGDFFDLSDAQLSEVTAVFDRASLIAMPLAMREAYRSKMQSILPKSVKILLITMEYPQEQMDGPPFSVRDEEVTNLFSGQFSITLLEAYDVLASTPRFIDKGLTEMVEKVYVLERD